MTPRLLCKALADEAQIRSRVNLPVAGIEVLMVGRPVQDDLLSLCRDHFEVLTIEVGDRVADGVPVDPLSPDPRVREAGRARIAAVLDGAEKYDAEAVTVHLSAGARLIRASEAPPRMDREATMEAAREYFRSLGPRLVVENVLPLDYVGAHRVSCSAVGRLMDDFAAVGLPTVLDTAHLGATLTAYTTGRPDIRLYWGPVERAASRRALGLNLTDAVLAEVDRLPPEQLRHVHVGNCRDYDIDCDGRVDGDLELDRLVRALMARGPRFLIPEVLEEDYVAYQHNREMLTRLRSLLEDVEDRARVAE